MTPQQKISIGVTFIILITVSIVLYYTFKKCGDGYTGKHCEIKCDDAIPRCAKCTGTNLDNIVCTQTVEDTLFDLKKCASGTGCPIIPNTLAWTPYTGVISMEKDPSKNRYTEKGNCHDGMRDVMDGYSYCYHPDFTKIDPGSYEGSAIGKDLSTVNTTGLHDVSVAGLGIKKGDKVSIASEATSSLNPDLINMVKYATDATDTSFEYHPYSWFGLSPIGPGLACKDNSYCGNLVCSNLCIDCPPCLEKCANIKNACYNLCSGNVECMNLCDTKYNDCISKQADVCLNKCVNCRSDIQCSSGHCSNGICVMCKQDSDCPAGTCINKQCFNGNCSDGYTGKNCEFKCDDVMPRCAKCAGTSPDNIVCTQTIDDRLFDLKSCTYGTTGTYGCQINRSSIDWSTYTGVDCHGAGGARTCHGTVQKTFTLRDTDDAIIPYNYCYHPDFTQIDPSTYTGPSLAGVNKAGLADTSVAGIGLRLNDDSTISIASEVYGPDPRLDVNTELFGMVEKASGKTAVGSYDTINWFGVKYQGKAPQPPGKSHAYAIIVGIIIGILVLMLALTGLERYRDTGDKSKYNILLLVLLGLIVVFGGSIGFNEGVNENKSEYTFLYFLGILFASVVIGGIVYFYKVKSKITFRGWAPVSSPTISPRAREVGSNADISSPVSGLSVVPSTEINFENAVLTKDVETALKGPSQNELISPQANPVNLERMFSNVKNTAGNREKEIKRTHSRLAILEAIADPQSAEPSLLQKAKEKATDILQTVKEKGKDFLQKGKDFFRRSPARADDVVDINHGESPVKVPGSNIGNEALFRRKRK